MRAQIEKSCDLRKDTLDSGRDSQPISSDKGKGLVVPDDVDTPADDELSSSSSPSLNLSLAKNTRECTTRKKPSPHLAFSDAVSGASRRARREAGRRHYRVGQARRNSPMLPLSTLPPVPPMHPAFGTLPTFYIPPVALIRRSDDMLSSPLGQYILDYEPPHWFVILAHSMARVTPTTICSTIIKR